MMGAQQIVPILGYALAAATFASILVFVLLKAERPSLRLSLYAALAAGCAWSVLLSISVVSDAISGAHIYYAEILHDALWLLFLNTMFTGAVSSRWLDTVRVGGVGVAAALLLFGAVLDIAAFAGDRDGGSDRLLAVASVLTSLYVLYLLEQAYQNARTTQRRGLRFFALGLGSIFAYDLFLFTDAILSGQVNHLLWNARGYVVAICLPVFVYGIFESRVSGANIFISRKVVGYSATVLAAFGYFAVIGLILVYLSSVGGDLGAAAQIVGLFAAALLLVLILFSTRLRARFNVFVSKHFYESKYDYREQWLNLMATLNANHDLPLKKRCVRALAQVFDAERGWLWLRDGDTARFECVSGWNETPRQDGMPLGGELIRFMQDRRWIVDWLADSGAQTDGQAERIKQDLPEVDATGLLLPLFDEGRLFAFVVIDRMPRSVPLTFEDLDVLRTAGQQIASYLLQEMATEELAQSRQFEAVNKLTTFLMHDLKNLVAQQSMIVENAKQHRRNPDFVDDAFETISNSVVRMRHVLAQLDRSGESGQAMRVNLKKPASHAINSCLSGTPVPVLEASSSDFESTVNPDRLSTVLQHLIRNAQDATPESGSIGVSVMDGGNGFAVIEVRDTGSGMSKEFIRDRLFRPFDSTKGARGMGIGVYQAREYVRSMGGELHVSSEEGKGTTVHVKLPTAGAPG